MNRRDWTALVVLASLWGASYLFIKVALDDVFSPAWIAFARTALAALLLLPIAHRMGALAGLRRHLPAIFGLAAIQIVAPFLMIAEGERHIASSLAGILVATAPIFTFLLAIRVDQDERVRGAGIVGVALGIGGVILLLGVDAGGGGAALMGALLVVVASVGYAIGGFIVKDRLSSPEPIGVVAGSMAASALMLAPLAAISVPESAPSAEAVASIAVLGILGTGLSFVIFYTLINRIGPGRASLVAYIAPGFAVIYGVALLGEAFALSTAAGLIAIVGGSWIAAEGRMPWQARTSFRSTQEVPA